MKVGTLSMPPEAAADRTPAAGDGSLAKEHWRRALEQAQWELRSHYRPEGEAGTASRKVQPAPERTLAAAPRAEAAFGGAAGGGSAHALASEADLSSSRAAAAYAPAGEAGGPGPYRLDPLSLGDPLLAAGVRDTGALRAVVAQCVQSCVKFPETKWLPVSVQVLIEGQKLSVTLRDARISEREAAEIHYRLRDRLAGMGLELHELMINGHPVTDASSG